MATVRLWQRFEVTVNGTTYTGGSLSADTAVTAGDGEVFDTTILIPNTGTGIKVFDVARELGGSSDFDFMWLENRSSTAGENIQIQITGDAGTNDDFFVKTLGPGESLVLMSDAAVTGTSIDDLSTSASASTIDEVWALADSGTPGLRVFAIS